MNNLTVCMAVAVIAAWPAVRATAQVPDRPTLTIERFEGNLKVRDTGDAGMELADALATLVQESGCCRVMPRAWLPNSTAEHTLALNAVSESANAANVEYVVASRIAKSRTIQRPALPAIAALGQTRPSGLPFAPGAIRGRFAPPMAQLMLQRPQVVSTVTLSMRILEARTGKVLRTVTVSSTEQVDDLSFVTSSSQVSDALIQAVSSLARERR